MTIAMLVLLGFYSGPSVCYQWRGDARYLIDKSPINSSQIAARYRTKYRGGFGLYGARSPPEGQGSYFSTGGKATGGGSWGGLEPAAGNLAGILLGFLGRHLQVAANTTSREASARPVSVSKGPTSQSSQRSTSAKFRSSTAREDFFSFPPPQPDLQYPHLFFPSATRLRRRFLLKSSSRACLLKRCFPELSPSPAWPSAGLPSPPSAWAPSLPLAPSPPMRPLLL